MLRIGMVLAGLLVGLLLAEVAFRYRDDGAFPHLNVYRPDRELGVRLAPGAAQRLAFGGNPVTTVRINSDGFRGDELPAPGGGEVLVVGDSQVFGLGVEEAETFSAKLQQALGKTVVNGGVPTYGPAEYRAMIVEQLAKRHPKTVVLTLNLVNDLFEAHHANKDRHAVWDGWAVRKETAPDGVTEFPGRDLLFRRSHLFFALRRWWHKDDRIDERGFASEGSWDDLLKASDKVKADHTANAQHVIAHGEELAKLQRELAKSQDAVDHALEQTLQAIDGTDYTEAYNAIHRWHANPGDIVEELNPEVEGGRSIVVTAEHLRRAQLVRAKLRTQLEQWAKAKRKDAAKALDDISAHDKLVAKLTEVDAQRIEAALDPPLGNYVRDVKQVVESAGARLVVLILPIDVQVDAREWAKYGSAPRDMSGTKAFTDELVALCASLGVTAVDASVPLAAAEPGAFLDKDIHMTPKGHAAVAAALAKALAQPPPHGASSERTPIPVPGVWQQAPEAIVTGSTDASCETKRIREWLRVMCTRGTELTPTQIAIDRDDGHEAISLVMPHGIALLVPVVEGRQLAATITWPDKTRVLRVEWPKSAAKPTIAFDKPKVLRGRTSAEQETLDYAEGLRSNMSFVSPVERAICDCWNRLAGGTRYKPYGAKEEIFECAGVYGAPDAQCTRTYDPGPATPIKKASAADAPWPPEQLARCERMMACIRKDPASPP